MHSPFRFATVPRLMTLLLAIGLMFFSGVCWAFNPDAFSFSKAPKHCQARLVELGEKGAVWGYRVPDSRPYNVDRYKQMMGDAWKHMHHYCSALDSLIKYEIYSSSAAKKKWGSEGSWRKMMMNFDYQLEKTHWDDGLRWFKAEVLTNKARAYRLAGQRENAISHFQSAINTYSPYLAAYWDLAALYEDMGSYDLAQETLRKARQFTRKDAYKQKIDKKISQLSKFGDGDLTRTEGGQEAASAQSK